MYVCMYKYICIYIYIYIYANINLHLQIYTYIYIYYLLFYAVTLIIKVLNANCFQQSNL